jgi:hypothetical protein
MFSISTKKPGSLLDLAYHALKLDNQVIIRNKNVYSSTVFSSQKSSGPERYFNIRLVRLELTCLTITSKCLMLVKHGDGENK